MRLALADHVTGRICASSTLRASVVVVALFIFGTLLPATAAAAVQRAAFRIDPPVAHAGHDLSAHVGDVVTLDGSNSHDPAADAGVLERALITYRWSIANAPPGSTASIDTTSPAPVLVPDVPGAYVLQLAVVASDGSVSAPAEVTVNAYVGNAAPVALVDDVRYVTVGTPVEVDAQRSFDPDGGALVFRWSFASVPRGSRLRDADMNAAESAIARFTPDAEGDYVVALQVGDGEFVTHALTQVRARTGLMPPLVDARATAIGDEIALDGSTSHDANPASNGLSYAWSLVARPAGSRSTLADIRDADHAQARFTPDADGIYVFRLRVANDAQSDAQNVLVHFGRVKLRNERVTASPAMTGSGPGSLAASTKTKGSPNSGVARLAFNVRPRSLDVIAGGRASFEVRLVGSAGARRGDHHEGLQLNPKMINAQGRGAGVRVEVSGLPMGATAQIADRELALGETTSITVTTASTTPPGVYSLRLTGLPLGLGVAIVRSTTIALRVRAPLLGGAPVACGNIDLSKVARPVYVSPKGNDATGCGAAPASACASIQTGIDACSGAGCAVLVRYGSYRTTATITLKDGVSVYGGCTFGSATNPNDRTLIDANPTDGGPAIRADTINAPTRIERLAVIAKDETASGKASIAMVVNQSRGLVMSQVVLASGRGGDGASGGSNTVQAGPGGPGQDGSVGGARGQSCTANHVSSAGDGGDGQVSAAPGSKGPSGCVISHRTTVDGQPSGTAAGGAAGTIGSDGVWCPNRPHDFPDVGGPGGNGQPGTCGAPARISALSGGSFTGATWQPSRGDSGQPGSVGAGGGGGGAGGACADFSGNDIAYYGLPGGGGGGGGCGGGSGGAGQQGGASIPLVIADSMLTWDGTRNAVIPGPAGKGGNGGNAAAGGQGGHAGAGVTTGQTLFWGHYCGAVGANGGIGGWGGAGSAGAGGNGGPSIGIALAGASPIPSNDTGIYAASPGAPGRGGIGGAAARVDGACRGADGQWAVAGLAAGYFDFNGSPPRNFLASGDQLVPGQSRVSLDGSTEFTLQTDGNLCLHKAGNRVWCSEQNENGVTGNTFKMGADGQLCLTDAQGSGWCVEGNPGAYLVITDDGRVVMYDGLTALWQIP